MKLSRYFFIAAVLAVLLTAPFARAADISVENVNNQSTVPAGQPISLKIGFESIEEDHGVYEILVGVTRQTSSLPTQPEESCTFIQNKGTENTYFFTPSESGDSFDIAQITNNSGSVMSDETTATKIAIKQNITLDKTDGIVRVYAVLIGYSGDLFLDESSNPDPGIGASYNYSEYKNVIADQAPACGHAQQVVIKQYTIGNGQVQDNGSSSSKTGGSASTPKASANTSVSGFGVVGTSKPETTAREFCDPNLAVQLGDTTTSGKKTSLGTISFKAANLLGLCNTSPILQKVINVAAILASIAFIIAIIYSGIILITATSEDAAAKAKKNLTWAVIGAVIVILANWVVPEVIRLVLETLNAP